MTSLPFKLYSTFVIEEKYGFNKMTPGTFVCDLVKELILSIVLTALLLPLLLWVVDISGQNLVFYMVSTCFAITILF